MSKRWALKRRDFLKALGVGAGMLPLLTETRLGWAEGPSARGRLIVIVKGNGVRGEDFWPTFPNGRPPDGALKEATFPFCTKPLEPFRDRLIFPQGIAMRNWLRSEGNSTGDNGDAHHNWGTILTGELPSEVLKTVGGCRINEAPAGCRMQAASASLDAYVGSELQAERPELLFRSLHTGVGTNRGGVDVNAYNTPSWFGRDIANGRAVDPYKLFDRLFEGVSGPSKETIASWRERAALLDHTRNDIERFRRRLGAEDRAALESHVDAVDARRRQLDSFLGGAGACTPPALTSGISVEEKNTGALSHLFLDLIVDAMKCGVVSSAVHSLLDSNGYDAYFTWLKDVNPNFSDSSSPGLRVSEFPELHFHSMTHGHSREPATQMYRDANRWHIEQLAYLLERLESEPEGSGTMLDHTLVLYVDTLSNGAGHTIFEMPWILAGNVAGYFDTGRHVRVKDDAAANGLFVAIANALGVGPDKGVFGNAQFGSGELPGLRA